MSKLQTCLSFQILTNRVTFLRKPDAPSIPSPGQAFGFEENNDGTLNKQPPPERDNSLGPAFYSVNEVRFLIHKF